MAEVQTPTGASAKDTALMTMSIVVLLAGIVAFYWQDEQPLLIRIAMEQGLRFAIREGGKTVGAGVVAKVIA